MLLAIQSSSRNPSIVFLLSYTMQSRLGIFHRIFYNTHTYMKHNSIGRSLVFLLTILLSVFNSQMTYAKHMSYILSGSNGFLFESSEPTDACCYRETKELPKLVDLVSRCEQGLNLDSPEDSEMPIRVVAQGSTTLTFTIDGWDDYIIRRLPGFQSFEDAEQHVVHIDKYRHLLHSILIETTDTDLIALDTPGGYGVVYVIQPYLRGEQLAINMIKKYGTRFKQAMLKKQIEIIRSLVRYAGGKDVLDLSVDIVSNNFEVYDFDSDTFDFKIRLNDIAQPLFKINRKTAYDFSDQAFSIVSPLNWWIVQPQMQAEFEDYYEPRYLLLSSLWGYEDPDAGTSYYPQWAMDAVNDVAEEWKRPLLSSEEISKAYHQDTEALSCFRLYRNLTRNIRRGFGLNSNVYMNPGNSSVEMYGTQYMPGYLECFFK